MNIKELKDLIKELPDEMSVRILVSSGSSTLTYPGKCSKYVKGNGLTSLVFERDKTAQNKINNVRTKRVEPTQFSPVPKIVPSPLSLKIPGK